MPRAVALSKVLKKGPWLLSEFYQEVGTLVRPGGGGVRSEGVSKPSFEADVSYDM